MVDSTELKKAYSSHWWELSEDLSGLYPELNEDIAPLQDEPLTYNYSPRFSFKQPFVAEVPDITLAGPDTVAITDDGSCILDTLNSRTNTQHMRLGSAIKKAVTDSPMRVGTALWEGQRPTATDTESVAAVLRNYWSPNYYHWTLEELLKLRGITHYERVTGNEVTVIIPSNPPRFVIESLELLGYRETDYMEWDKDRDPLHVDRLIVPSFPELTPKTLAWLQNEMTKRVDPPTTSSTGWVYVSRQNAAMRRVVNYGEVETVLDRYGIQPVTCENLSLEEEIRLFSSADGIIGPHGAGLTAAVWASDVQLVELFNETVKAPYYVLAHVLGHEYTALSGDAVGDIDEPRNKNIYLDITDLEAVLDRVVN